MSSDAGNFEVPAATEQAFLTDGMNSTLLYMYLMGMYTAVSIYTIYLYARKKQGRSIIVACSLLILLVTSIAVLALQWKLTNVCSIDNGQSVSSTFTCTFNVTQTAYDLAVTALVALQSIIADGLLVWRCYHLAAKSLYKIWIPLIFISLELVMGVTQVTTTGILIFRNSSVKMEKITDGVNAVFFSITALTTVSSTVFICQRINHSMRGTRHIQWYKKVILFAIESSVIYSISSILNVIDSIIGITSTNLLAGFAFDEYTSSCVYVMTTLAPTLMITQITLHPNPGSTIVHNTLPMSTLQFYQQETDGIVQPARHGSLAVLDDSENSVKEQA